MATTTPSVMRGELWMLSALLLAGCSANGGVGASEASGTESPAGVGVVVRPVSQEDLPAAIASCLEDEGFPSSGVAPDGSLEYGPFTETQDEDFLRVDEMCRARYPLESDFARDATPEDWLVVYRHQRDVWIPCMQEQFGIELGQMPSQEAFMTSPQWVDASTFQVQLQAAVADDALEHMNAWIASCPDFPPALLTD